MFNVKVEFDNIPIRHIAVQCPKCNNWFHGWDIIKGDNPFDELRYKHQINWAEFKCPVCEKEFGGLQHNDGANIKEVGGSEVYEGCLQRKEIWA